MTFLSSCTYFIKYCISVRTGRKDLVVGSIPTNFIAKRSHKRQVATERRQLVGNSEIVLPVLYMYRDFKEL